MDLEPECPPRMEGRFLPEDAPEAVISLLYLTAFSGSNSGNRKDQPIYLKKKICFSDSFFKKQELFCKGGSASCKRGKLRTAA